MRRKNERGQALVAVLAVMAVLTLGMGAFGSYVMDNSRGNQQQVEEAQARYAAEAALHRTIGHLSNQTFTDWTTVPTPAPNPMTIGAPAIQAKVAYTTQLPLEIVVRATGYVLVAGYALQAGVEPPAAKVRARVAIEAKLQKAPVRSMWGYAAYAEGSENFHGIVHGSLYSGTKMIQVGAGEAILNDYTYDPAVTPNWLQAHLNGLDASQLRARAQALAGDIKVSGGGRLGSVANPLASVGINPPNAVTATDYYLAKNTVPTPPPNFFPGISNAQLDGVANEAPGIIDYRIVAGDALNPESGCVWDTPGDLVTNRSRSLTLAVGGDNPNCSVGSGSFVWDPANNLLTINGTVFVDGDVTIGDSTFNDIHYRGRGMIVAKGNIYINGGIRPDVMADFSRKAQLGFVTQGDIKIDPQGPGGGLYAVTAGIFYAGGNVRVQSASILVGAIAAGGKIVTLGRPVIYQDGDLLSNILPLIPNNPPEPHWVKVTNWRVVSGAGA